MATNKQSFCEAGADHDANPDCFRGYLPCPARGSVRAVIQLRAIPCRIAAALANIAAEAVTKWISILRPLKYNLYIIPYR